jgi:hypothetical protein
VALLTLEQSRIIFNDKLFTLSPFAVALGQSGEPFERIGDSLDLPGVAQSIECSSVNSRRVQHCCAVASWSSATL